ncbi:MAG: orotate phosphoribosyltransferase [Alphaproteobacteria bacterium]|nr:orotate phosphoribosyltransferase [Alphaproteobacteria bacterium]
MTSEEIIAEKLLQAGVLKISPNEFFTWTSGLKSPIYCNNRILLSQPMYRDLIKSELSRLIFEHYPDAEVIAGVSTAGIPWASLVADSLKMKLVYVRPEPKAHGLKNQIEGEILKGESVVVIEDLISTGKSSLGVINALKAADAKVEALVSIFNYNFESTLHKFEDINIKSHALSNFFSLLKMLLHKNIYSESEIAIVEAWRLQQH